MGSAILPRRAAQQTPAQHLGGGQSPGHFLPVGVNGALVPLNAWGRVADGRALKDAGVIGWHLDFADPWRSCWGRQINNECYDERTSLFPVFKFIFHMCNNKTPGTPVLHRFGLGLRRSLAVCPAGVGLEAPCTPLPLHPAGQQPQGKQGERTGNAKHLHFTEILKVTDALVSLLKA